MFFFGLKMFLACRSGANYRFYVKEIHAFGVIDSCFNFVELGHLVGNTFVT